MEEEMRAIRKWFNGFDNVATNKSAITMRKELEIGLERDFTDLFEKIYAARDECGFHSTSWASK